MKNYICQRLLLIIEDTEKVCFGDSFTLSTTKGLISSIKIIDCLDEKDVLNDENIVYSGKEYEIEEIYTFTNNDDMDKYIIIETVLQKIVSPEDLKFMLKATDIESAIELVKRFSYDKMILFINGINDEDQEDAETYLRLVSTGADELIPIFLNDLDKYVFYKLVQKEYERLNIKSLYELKSAYDIENLYDTLRILLVNKETYMNTLKNSTIWNDLVRLIAEMNETTINDVLENKELSEIYTYSNVKKKMLVDYLIKYKDVNIDIWN